MVKQATVEVSSNRQWWRSLGDEECPITLESLSSLPYPPFSLANHQSTTSSNSVTYFDGVALASYIVSRGIFENPLTRQELSAETCKRLDDHLKEHCSDYLQDIGGARQISVAEAHALRSIVHVERGSGGNTSNNNNESRARVLRNTATAALAGLFVYGNDRRQRGGRQGTEQQSTSIVAELPREDRLTLEWGFDLSKPMEDTAEYGGNGWTIIDDDEALVVASKREAYQAAQNSFPRLSDSSNDVASAAATSANGVDAQLLGRVRQLAVDEEESQAAKERRLQLARQQLLEEALQRREERKRERTAQLKKVMEESFEKKKEAEEVEKARTEIEAWRNEQWERLRAISDAYQQKEKAKEKFAAAKKDTTSLKTEDAAPEHLEEEIPDEDPEERKKAKAAAKRKRAKARKKAQKSEERAKAEQKAKEEAILAKKAASAVQCGACGQGIVDCGFEKFDQKFCSPKCARTAVRI